MKRFLYSSFLVSAVLAGLCGVVDAAKPSASEKIDAFLYEAYAEHGIEPNAPVSDEVFVRRIYLDVAGRVPTMKEAGAFLESEDASKRAKLIDELLDSEGYVNHFYNFWADILRVNTRANNSQFVFPAYASFVKSSLRENKPYDEFVRELITAKGDAWDNGAIGYYMRDRGMPLDNMSNTVRVFLGTRLECAQCHNHPFDKWSQMDYYQMAAFSYGMRADNYTNENMREAGSMVREMVDDPKKERDVRKAFTEIQRPLRYTTVTKSESSLPKLPDDYQYEDGKPKETILPRTMFGDEIELTADERDRDRVKVYAEWLTSEENPRFATVIANRLWKKVFGRAFIEPVDEMLDETEATNPKLMAFLEEQMKANGFDMKAFLRMILNTEAYQREATTEEVDLGDVYHFPGPMLRRMSAEQIWDSVVTLVNPDPDAVDSKSLEQVYKRMDETRKIAAAIDTRSPEQLAEAAIKVAKVQESLRREYDLLQEQITEAREDKDVAKVKKLSSEVNGLRNKVRASVEKTVFEPGMKKLGESGGKGGGMYEMDGRPTPEEIKAEREELEKDIQLEMDDMGLEDRDQRKGYYSFRVNVGEKVKRAANLESPAPRGHFLRQFGQSDRETIENANYDASVPQALELLNGETFGVIENPYSALAMSIKQAATPEDRIDAIFMSLLSRPADDEEKGMLVTAVMEGGDQVYKDIVYSLLNTSQFLFIQ